MSDGQKTWFQLWCMQPQYQLPRGWWSLSLVPSVNAEWRSNKKSFHTVDLGQAWFGYLKVGDHWLKEVHFGFVTQSARWVPVLLVMLVSVVMPRYSWQHWATCNCCFVEIWRERNSSTRNWSCCHCGNSQGLSSQCIVRPYSSLISQRWCAQQWSTYQQTRDPLWLRMLHNVPAWSCRQSSLTWRLLPTISVLHRWPIISLFLLAPWIGQSSGTSIPA